MTPKILIVDDDNEIIEIILKLLGTENYMCDTSNNIAKAKELMKNTTYDVIISDLIFPNGSGLELLKFKNEISSDSMFILLTGYKSATSSLKALQMGAFDYISKPFRNVELLMVVKKAIQTKNLIAEEEALKKAVAVQDKFGLIYKSKKMDEIVELARKVAESQVNTILIEGETGVGKEVLARTIHRFSDRQEKPFIEINCAALPENLLESELFGHEKGSFTGASEMKRGLLEVSMGGTVLLDEIGEISPLLQAKLLRFVETKTFFRVGGTRKVNTDVRIIAATNKNLDKEVQNNKFRSDLYYRLKVISFNIPPLRERRDDIMPLIEYYINFYNKMFHKNVTSISPEAQSVFEEYNWPGNIRELRNVVERIVLLEEDNKIALRHIPLEMLTIPDIAPGNTTKKTTERPESLITIERRHIENVLQFTQGNKTETAKLLGISRKTLWEKLKRYKITQ